MRFVRSRLTEAWFAVSVLVLSPAAVLRPAIPGTVLRMDETVGFYEDPATGDSGVT